MTDLSLPQESRSARPGRLFPAMTPDDLSYRAAFERLWDSASGEIVPNSQPTHAAALLAVFFAKATRGVRIFCKNLDPAVYDQPELIAAARTAIGKIKIEILVQEPVFENSIFAQLIMGSQNCDTTPILLNKGPAPEKIRGLNQNFATADGRAFRLEGDRDQFKAVASANHPKLAETLDGFFEAIRDNVVPALHASTAR